MPERCNFLIGFLLLLSTWVPPASAQMNSGSEVITSAQGLSQGMINDMLQDKEGFIWIATKGGLNRYDGYSFKIFTNDPQDTSSISSNAVNSLLEDRNGRLWIGTSDGGVNVYNKKTGRFLRITRASGLSGNRINAPMEQLANGKILVCPQGGSLSTISLPDGGTPVITPLHIPGGRTAKTIVKDEKELAWIKCTDNSIFIFNPAAAGFELLYDGQGFTSLIERTGKFVSAKFSQALSTKPIPDIRAGFIDSTGHLYPNILDYGKDGMYIIDHRFPLRTGATGCNIYDFNGIKPGNKISDAYARNLKTDVKDQNIKCLLLDRSGVLWVGTMGHGVYKYRIQNARFHSLLPNLSIQRLTVWDNDMLYVQGWRTAKLLTPQGKELVNPVDPFIDDGLAYTQVLRTKNGDHWLYWNVRKKIFHYTADMQLAATYTEPVNTTTTEHLQPLIEDSRHRIWVCGANGTLARIDPATGGLSKFTINIGQYTGATGLTQTTAFYEDGQGIFWLGTEHGFARLEFNADATAPQVQWYKNIPGNSNSLSYNYVSRFMDDPADAGYLWICTKGGGLNRMEKSTGTFTHYTTKQGIPNDEVYGVLADRAGNIWGSTNKGIFCMLAGQKEEQPVIRVFTTSDGLQADEFNTNALARLSNGDLVFGGVNGINIFNPQKVLATCFKPPVYITGIQIGNKTIVPGDETGVLKETIEQTHTIALNYQQDVLTLEFSSLDFSSPAQNKYRYQLTGIDKEWVESGFRRTATYLHLPPGNYTFKVQGSNSQGIWSEHTATLKINVRPPWWRSWWAYIVYALLIGLAIKMYLRFKVNKATLQSQLKFEKLEAKRAKELDTIKTQLYTNITHEFRTPLTVILGMAQQVKDKPAEDFDNRMNMIVRNGQNLLRLVNELLDLSKLETNKMQLQTSTGEMVGFLRYLAESFQSLAASQQKQLHFLATGGTLYLKYDKERIEQIVSNLLSNAIKFTPENGHIYLSVAGQGATGNAAATIITIQVKDTGIGIPEAQLPYIFDRFYQADNSATRKAEGTGIGLALTKELVKLMAGEITVTSVSSGVNRGSEFTVQLPLENAEPPASRINGTTTVRENTIVLKEAAVPATAAIQEKNEVQGALILLVEDNADVVAYIRSCLPGYRLAVGSNGREGLRMAAEIIPDLIITDVMMPYVDGFELTAQLRSNEYTSHIPVIMLTARADMQSRIEGLQSGADVYLQKPFNKEELLVHIEKLLEMRRRLRQYYLVQAGVENAKTAPIWPELTIEEKKEDAFVKKVREAIEENLTDAGFTVEKLCRLVFMSHSQLHRKLEALTGCAPNKFIRMIRLRRAKDLLHCKTDSIASIALDCGYNDPGYFARVFKQEYGVTPQEWRTANE